jgi:hypothetical protein
MNELYRRLFKAGNQTACRAIETRWLAEMCAVLREEEARPREHVERFWMPEMDDEAEFCFDEMSEHYWKCECECFCWEHDTERWSHNKPGRRTIWSKPHHSHDESRIPDDSQCRLCLCGYGHEPPTEAELEMRKRKGIPFPSH